MRNTLDDWLHTQTYSKGLFTYDIVKEVCVSLKNGIAEGFDIQDLEGLFCGISYPFYFLECSVKLPFQFKAKLILLLL